jgi:hypothetical protein
MVLRLKTRESRSLPGLLKAMHEAQIRGICRDTMKQSSQNETYGPWPISPIPRAARKAAFLLCNIPNARDETSVRPSQETTPSELLRQ